MKMPFGKHKGMELEELPRPYLVWLRKNVQLFGQLQAEVEAILDGTSLEHKESTEETLKKMGLWSKNE